MDKGYSGLRRTRKRAHSSKCPCCYSSEEEEGHHAITKKEKIKDSNHNNGKPTRTRKRKLASDEDDSTAIDIASSPADSVDENQNSKKPQKTVVSEKPKKKGASRNSTISHQESAKNAGDTAQVSEQGKKQSGKARKAGSKKKTRTGNKDESERGISLVGSEHGLKKLPSNELHSTSRKVRKRKKNGNSDFQTDAGSADKNELEFKDKSLKSKKNAKTKASTSSKNIGAQKVSSKDIGSSGLVDKGTLSVDTQKPGTKNNNTGKYKQDRPSRGKNSKSGVVSSGLSWRLSEEKEHTIPLESNKHPNGSSSIHVKRKIEAFDHLFSELKKCPGFSKITVSSAAETLLKLTADKLKIMLPSVSPKKSKPGMDIDKLATDKLQPSSKAKTSCTLSERKRRRTDSEKSSSVSSAIDTSSCLSSPKKTVPVRGEEAKLSQAAEALVSFRANPTILRQEKTEAEVWPGQSTDKDIVNASTQKKSGATQSSVVKSPLETVTSAEALTVSKVIDSVNDPLQGQVASQPWSTLMQGALNQTMRFPTRSEADMQQIATVQQSMVNLNQVTSQFNSATTIPTPVVHTVSTPRTASLPTSGMNSIMMSPVGVQNIQALLCRPTQPSTLQTPVAQTSAPPLSAGGNNQQLHPQQPLKGMENVVSCVGSRTATNLLWNIKPATAPVVYLTSPQTLSGVRARNLIPQSEGHITLPLTTGMGKVQSVGITKTSLSSTSSGLLNLGKVTFVNQAVPLSVATVTGQRPILPREQRLPSLLPSVPQTASQMPVTTVVGPIPHNIPPVPVGSIPVQFSSLGVNTSLSAQQTSNSNVVMQAPVPEVTITQATVTQSPLVQVACVTTTQPTNLTPVSAKQAVKKFVHERTKSAELKRSSSLNSLISNECITSTAVPERPQTSTITPSSSQECQSMDQSEKEGISHQSMEFNLHQAASALLSISSQDVLDTMNAAQPGVGEGEDSMDEHDDEVVFTSKGVFRVGDVDVDPKYNRIGREGYTCGKCGKIFTSLSYLARHIKRVCPDMSCRKWKCTMCDKAFRHPFGLQQHIYTHTGERPHKCSQCPKAFYSSNDLRRHSRIHSGERPYHCKHCDKSFATTISLKTHTYIHTGEKPHKCPHCPKTFATSSKLGRHIVTHSEQRPFACDHCPKSFNRSGDLRRHNMHVHECREKPFEFEGCVTPPSTASNLTEDMTKDLENVTRQMIHCSVCEEMFDSSSDLGLHMLSHDVPDSLVQDRNA